MLKTSEYAGRRGTALLVALTLLGPLVVLPALPVQAQVRKPGMSTGKKVALLAGAGLLYYLYRKHTAAQAQQAQVRPGQPGATTTMARRPQLYRSKNGGIYYRDPNGKPVWLTVPNRSVEVPMSDLQRYAPDYRKYRGPAPSAPRGYRTQSFSDFDPSMASAFGRGAAPSNAAPGPRGRM